MWKIRIVASMVFLLGGLVGGFIYFSEIRPVSPFSNFPFILGLDLKGGTHLTYRADVSGVSPGDVPDALESLRNVVERRVNIFGVSEPVVQVERSGILNATSEERLIVELPGVTDINEAVKALGATPILEFKLLKNDIAFSESDSVDVNTAFESTGLTGRFLERSLLEFDPTTSEPTVVLQFNSEGKALFAEITRNNVGRILAIFLDGAPISTPVIREEIPDGRATISGGFNPEEAKALSRDLNYGALPVPIELVGTQTIGASLGDEALSASVWAGLIGFILVALFLIFWYRLPGVIAVIALLVYVSINLAIFKLIPVTLTAAGLAAFILSIGMAVDANILIFERMKEELRRGRALGDAIREGFARAWLSIRDSNLSSIITALILFWLGGTAIIKGFALVFLIGVLVSMFTAISVSRTLLFALGFEGRKNEGVLGFLFGNGLSK